MVTQDGTGIIIYNEATESIIFKDEFTEYTFEFATNKVLSAGSPFSHLYLIIDWSSVKCIHDPNTANIYKTFVFTLP